MIKQIAVGYTVNKESEDFKKIKKEFEEAMDNDFNTSIVISNLFNYITLINKAIHEEEIQKSLDIIGAIIDMYEILGLFQQNPDLVINSIRNKYLKLNSIDESYINNLIIKRLEYKKNKNYDAADAIRNTLLEKGIIIKDGFNGTKWDIRI